jgi:hypothetical protein
MALRYNSWEVQLLKAEKDKQRPLFDFVGIYIPCNTPLIHKLEHHLLNDLQAAIISEHHFVLTIAYRIAETLSAMTPCLGPFDEQQLRARLEFMLGSELPPGVPVFTAVMDLVQKENLDGQRTINSRETTSVHYEHTFSFSSLVVPLLGASRAIPALKNAHFMLLLDDAHLLNDHQLKALNSWIAYRDHSLFSFKVAFANIRRALLKTSTGGSILEGHDYTRLDLVHPFQNEMSDFGHLAHRVIARRLQMFGLRTKTPEKYFPESANLKKELEAAKEKARDEALHIFAPTDKKKIADYVYKFGRAYYFRERSPKANRPEYSGFDTLVFLSTGVVRNLLIPCYWMYEKMLSLSSEDKTPCDLTKQIPPHVQAECILDRSRILWDWLRDEIDLSIEGCSRNDRKHAYQLMDNLGTHFRERLLRHKSEPRANSFTVSAQDEALMPKLEHLFDILREAQLLYIRSGSAKDRGRREKYYVPNRMLWPERGLDPHGQHARVSLSAKVLWLAATKNTPIPLTASSETPAEPEVPELELFE